MKLNLYISGLGSFFHNLPNFDLIFIIGFAIIMKNKRRLIVAATKKSLNFNDICILHLSDLHIAYQAGRKYAASLDLLINDITAQLSAVTELILVVSGDVVDKGNFDKNNRDAVFAFFDKLYNSLNGKIKELIMVPGNHDKVRDKINKFITLKCQEDGDFLGEEEWVYQLKSYSGYIEIYNGLLQKYHPNKNIVNNTFGVHRVDIGGQNIIFVRLDTAWCSFSKDDSYKLRLGNYQSKSLVEQYQSCIHESNIQNPLTIGVSHFPINYLSPEEESECNKVFLSQDKLNLDVLLCGHVHNVSLAHYFNHSHSLLTLITGIGGNGESGVPENHRYSIYFLNIANNSCDIVMRKSGQSSYNYDYSIYTGKESIKENKLIYPIRVRESHSFIKMFAPNQIDTKSKFLDSNLLMVIPDASKALNSFAQTMSAVITYHKGKAYDDITDEWLDSVSYLSDTAYGQACSKLYEYFFVGGDLTSDEKNKWLNKDAVLNFSGFLTDMCSTLNRCLKIIFTKNVVLRTHFRVYDENSDTYISFRCQTNEIANSSPPKAIKWTRIMQNAFHHKEIIQYSANPKLNDIKTSWDDFITIIPNCLGNTVEKILNEKTREHEQRPCLTFGLSIKNTQPTDIDALSILSFLRIDNVITKAIDEYLQTFNIDLRQSLNELLKGIPKKKSNKRGNKNGERA